MGEILDSISTKCDFCNSKAAILYCAADSARLCLLCDHQVHSANALSLKHLRSLICDYCGSKPGLYQSIFDNHLVICQDCYNTHSSVSLCTPIYGFSGCPSSIEFAQIFGFDLKPKNWINLEYGSHKKMVNLRDFMVPSGNSSGFSSNGKCRGEMYEQLVELSDRENGRVNENKEEIIYKENPDDGDARDIHDRDFLWDCNLTQEEAQMWDFQIGSSGDCAETGIQEAWCGEMDPCLTIKNHGNLTEQVYASNIKNMTNDVCSIDDILSTNSGSDQQHNIHLPCDETEYTETNMELFAQNRDNAMMRYGQKKKSRSYDKRICYESRKARADMRKREKGCFVKTASST